MIEKEVLLDTVNGDENEAEVRQEHNHKVQYIMNLVR